MKEFSIGQVYTIQIVLIKPIIETTLARAQSFESKPFAIEVLPLENYYSAEEYHQDYLDKNLMVIVIFLLVYPKNRL